MSILFVSIATSGLLKADAVPWICRISAVLTDAAGAEVDAFDMGIRAEGRRIDAGATAAHGITSATAERSGVYELFALGAICGLKAGQKRPTDYPGMASYARTVVAWDAEFVRSIIGALFTRHGEPASAWLRPGLTAVSLRDVARPWCRLQADDGGYRYANRDEAASALLDAGPRPKPHTTGSNLDLERRLYAALRERGAFESEAA